MADNEADGPLFDVFLHGPLFFDIVFTGLPSMPVQGTEVFATGMGSLPGGIANLAVATARLGLSTSLAVGFGHDGYGDWIRRVLEEEGIDLSRSATVDQHTNVTVSMSFGDDRAMLTHGHGLPMPADALIGDPPRSRAVITDLTGERRHDTWWQKAAAAGSLVFADVGWDDTGAWEPEVLEPLAQCYAFAPNANEAMAYTRTATPREALGKLSRLVPLAVVTCGPDGAIARNRETGEEAHSPGIPLTPVDATGAGDNFAASLVHGCLAGWPLQQSLDFAVLASALSVTQFGGSLSAPGWGDIAAWFDDVSGARAGGAPERCPSNVHFPQDAALAARYEFLADAVPEGPLAQMRRAEATLLRHFDVG